MSLPVHSTKLFTWDKEARAFVAEISDIPRPLARQELGDVGDAGFFLMCEHGVGEPVYLTDTERDAEDEVVRWVFEPKSHDRYKVILFND